MNEQEAKAVHRGEMWYIAHPDNPSLGRPAVVLSNEKGCACAPDIEVVFTTTNTFIAKNRENVLLTTPRRTSVARCGNLTSVPRNQFQYKLCDLTAREMDDIEKAVHWALGFEDHGGDDNSQIIKERDFYKTLYFEVLRELAKKQIAEELPVMVELEREEVAVNAEETEEEDWECAEVVGSEPEAEEELPKSESEPESEPESESKSDEEDEEDEEGECDGAPVSLLKPEPKLKKKKPKTRTKVASTKTIHINYCAAHDLQYTCDLGRETAVEIIRYRNKHGRFGSIDDVARVPRVGKRNIKKLEGRLEFD